MEQKKDISIILLTYNADCKKLRSTLLSVISQKNVEIELIIADDGSKLRYDEKIIKMCEEYRFKYLRFSNLSENSGTCSSINKALSLVSSAYVKFISPGDFFYDDDTCAVWIEFMNKTCADISFGDAIYYTVSEDIHIGICKQKSPVQEILFQKGNRRALFVDYILANDTILGAALLMKTEIARRYMGYFDGKVKYAEDYMVRLAVFEDKSILHMPNNVIWYEFGQGISTTKNKKWVELLYKDFAASNQIIVHNCETKDRIAQIYATYLRGEGKSVILRKIKKCFIFPDVVFWRIKNKIQRHRVVTDVNLELLHKYLNDNQ